MCHARCVKPARLPPILLWSRTCQHALRAMERLAAADLAGEGLTSVSSLAKATGTPAPALGQVLHALRKAGLLDARRGRSGGVRLARPAAKITVLEVVRAVEGAPLEGRCVLGFSPCGDQTPCPAHPVWKRARMLLERRLEHRSLAHLARAAARKRSARPTN